MLKFVLITLSFVTALIISLALSIPDTYKLIICVLILFAYLAIMIWASSNIRSSFFVKTLNSNPNIKNKLAITFDDGPDSKNTPAILDLLNKYNAKASFFIIGSKAEKNKDLLKDIYNNNHLIGNHSYSHSNLFPLKSVKKIKSEILKTNKIIEEITNSDNKYFRPPFGVINPLIFMAVKQMNLTTIGWSVRSLDTKNENPEIVLKRITKKIKGGDIILFHDTSKNILEILEKFLY